MDGSYTAGVKLFSLFFILGGPLFGQLSFGVIGGVPFTDLTNSTSTSSLAGIVKSADQSGRYAVGPTVQLGLPLGFRVEADALYRPAAFGLGTVNFSSAQWRFPVLLQYRLSFPVVKPFVEAGYSYDHLNITGIQSTLSGTGSYSITSHHGFVMGAGVDFKVPFVRISPEIRYTRDIGANTFLNANQAEFLVGIRF
jgi:outer membrane protein with beta-barrel domain